MIDANKLSELLLRKESLVIEFKLKYNMSGQGKALILDEIAKDIVSLANSNSRRRNGSSFLIIGAGDKLSADGSRDKENVKGLYSESVFRQIVNERITPSIAQFEYTEIEANNNIYGVIEIPFSPHLHKISRDLNTPNGIWRKGSTIVRHNDAIGVATDEEIDEIKSSKANLSVYFLLSVLCAGLIFLIVVTVVLMHGKQEKDLTPLTIAQTTPRLSPVRIISSREGVSLKKTKRTTRVFQTKIFNPNRIAVDVIKISITAHIPPYQEFGCGEPPDEFFEISDQISVSEHHDRNAIGLDVDYKDLNSSKSTLFRAHGQAVVDGCMGEGTLSLSLDTMFKIQANETIVSMIQIPEKFTVIKTGIWTPDDPQKRAEYIRTLKEDGYSLDEKADLEKIKNGATSSFDKWKFCFLLRDGTSTCTNEI